MLPPRHIAAVLTRLTLCLAVVFASLLPSFAMATGAQPINVSRYICAPSPHSDIGAYESALRELLIASGKLEEDEQDGLPTAPCEQCVFTAFVQPSVLAQDAPSTIFAASEPIYFSTRSPSPYFALGPPLGGRAPPAHL